MKRALETLRIVVISIEAFWLVLMTYLFLHHGSLLAWLGENLLKHNDVTQWMPIVPFSLGGSSVWLSFKLLSPKDGSNRSLYDWPDYWRLEYRRNIGIVWCGVACLLVLIPWIFREALGNQWVGGLFLASIGIALISSASLLFAAFVLKQIVEE